MARRKIYKVKDFPAPGSIFAMPLADGRIGACRVLRVGMEFSAIHALVAASDWIENEAPSISHPAVRKTLWLTHHLHGNTPALIWVSEPPPKSFIFLGLIKLSKGDKSVKCNGISGWEYLTVQVLAQRDIEQIVQAFIRTLSKSKEPLAHEFVAQELTVCVEKLNQLDGERQIIETVEREDLYDVFEEILSAAKHPELLSIVDETRDW